MPASPNGHKVCTLCLEKKPLDLFFKNSASKTDGVTARCKACKKAALYEWRSQNMDKFLAHQAKYARSAKGAGTRAAYMALPETIAMNKERERIRSLAPKEKARKSKVEASIAVVSYRKLYKSRESSKARYRELARRPHIRDRAKRYQANTRLTPKGNIDSRMSNAIGQAIRKHRHSWVSLIGYSLAELMEHLERQFAPGMGWHNIGEWHIDHIVPKSTFAYSSATDREFVACWALSNLRPLWASLNYSKGAKRAFLI